jgi:N-methylhydantoinase A
MAVVHSVDLRYHGQGFEIPVTVDLGAFDGAGAGLAAVAARFDAEHERLFGFLLKNAHEVVTLRASATGPRPNVGAETLPAGGADPGAAKVADHDIWVSGQRVSAGIYDRSKLAAGAVVSGPAIITEMDSTTLVLPDHAAEVHPSGSLLINPVSTQSEEV